MGFDFTSIDPTTITSMLESMHIHVSTHLAPVKVLDDSEMQIFFSLPLALHGVVEELSEWPI